MKVRAGSSFWQKNNKKTQQQNNCGIFFSFKVATFTCCSAGEGFFFLFVSPFSASIQTVINNPLSLTPGVKGQNTCPCKHGRASGGTHSFPLTHCKKSCINVAAFDSGYISVIIELAAAGLLGSILMLSHRSRWARYKEKTRCDNISSIINRVASSLFPTDRPRIDRWWRRELIPTPACAHSEVRNLTASGRRKAEMCNDGRERSEKMKRSRGWSPGVSISRSAVALC